MISQVDVKKNTISKLLEELYTEYLRFKSSLEYLRTENAGLLALGDEADSKRRAELAELKALRFGDNDNEGKVKMDEEERAKMVETAGKIDSLERECDKYSSVTDGIKTIITRGNETMFHFNNLVKYCESEIYNKEIEVLK